MPSLKLIPEEKISTLTNMPPWYEEDIWLYKNLGIDGQPADTHLSFAFKFITQPWLKLIIKRFIIRNLCNKSCHTIRQLVSTMGSFSEFLNLYRDKNEINSINDINRKLVLEYSIFLANKDISKTTHQIRLLALGNFFEICNDLGWVNTRGKILYQEDIPSRPNKIPRFIPNSVLNQLNTNIQFMDHHVRRLLLILQETGMRINEVIKLPYSCIFQDKDGDYFLKYFQSKMNKDHIIPISSQLALTIKEQQQIITQEWKNHELLFPMPHYVQPINKESRIKKSTNGGQQWSRDRLSIYLNKFAIEYRILGPDGKPWRFQFHAFRHTVATQMINNQVPQHIVQRFLGHESPTMTSRYAHIFDETLKKEFSKFRGTMVNIGGSIVTPEQVAIDLAEGTHSDDVDVRWLKKHIMAQALPNGTCALPVISKGCPHANACLTCVNFRTDHRYLDTHKTQLEKTKIIIKQAKEQGWQRQLEMNINVQANLEKIINTLDTTNHDT